MKLIPARRTVNANGSTSGRAEGAAAVTGRERDRDDGRRTDAASPRVEDIRKREGPGVLSKPSKYIAWSNERVKAIVLVHGGFDETAVVFRGVVGATGGVGAGRRGAD